MVGADEMEEKRRGMGFGSLKLKGLTALKRVEASIRFTDTVVAGLQLQGNQNLKSKE